MENLNKEERNIDEKRSKVDYRRTKIYGMERKMEKIETMLSEGQKRTKQLNVAKEEGSPKRNYGKR